MQSHGLYFSLLPPLRSQSPLWRSFSRSFRVLKESLKRQRDITSNLVCKVEAEEENITLTLVKRLNQLRKEKEELAVSVEAEEEFVVNKLMKRLEVLFLHEFR